MKFEYTGNCTLKEKVNIVAEEIHRKYPEIDSDDLLKIALIDNKITKKVDNHIKFRRLYNILSVTFKNNLIFNKVLKDLIDIYNDISDKTILEVNLFNDIILFYKGSLEKFPIISEYL